MTDTDIIDDADVVVLGGGPVGMLTALLLARKGWTVHVIERWGTLYGRPRAVSFDAESLRTLQKLDLAQEMYDSSYTQSWYDWRTEDGRSLLKFDHRRDDPAGWHNLIFNQPTFERILEREIGAQPRVTLHRGVEVVDPAAISEDDEGVTVLLRATESNEPRGAVRGRYLIGADGANSLVRDKIGEPMTDLGFFFDWLIVDVIPLRDEDKNWGDTGIQICSPKRPTTVVGGGPGRRRWEFMLLPGETVAEMNTDETAWRLLAPFGFTPENAELERHTVYTFQARWAGRWNKGRLLIAGDAAHQMPPFAGQGLNSGIRDATNLTWKLDLVLAGKAAPQLLDSYTAERSEHVKHAIHFSLELGKVICVLDPEEARKRDERMLRYHGMPELGLPPLPPASFSRGVLYAHDGGCAPGGGVASPQFRVETAAGVDRFDSAVWAGTTLLIGDESASGLPPELRARFEALGGRVYLLAEDTSAQASDVLVDIEGGYRRELDRFGAVALLWRPDSYYFGTAADAAEITALVEEFIAQVSTGRFHGADAPTEEHELMGAAR